MEYISGTVNRVNGKGFTLADHDGWLNISKYASPTPALPTAGELVKVTLDKGGFVRKIEPAAAEPTPQPTAPTATMTTTATPSAAPDRERCIARMAALNTATAILASGGRAVDADDVIALAATLESWVYR